MKKNLTLLLVCMATLFFYAYCYPFHEFAITIGLSKEEVPHDMKKKYEAYHQISSQINKYYNLYGGVIGSTNNISKKKVEGICFNFRKTAKFTKDEAREISTRILLECISKVNENDKLKEYLYPYPFTHKNIELTIAFEEDSKITYQSKPFIGTTSFVSEKIYYDTYLSRIRSEPIFSTFETFNEAYFKVYKQLPLHLQHVAKESLNLSEEREKAEVEPIEYPNDDSHPNRVATRQWIEKSQAPRDAKGYLIQSNPSK